MRDVKGVGVKSDIKDVSDGYAVNFLIPRSLARQSTPGVEKAVKIEREKAVALARVREDLLEKSLKKIKGVKILITERANDKGHLFAAVHEKEVADKLKESSGIEVDPVFIKLGEPIKTVGEHDVKISVKDKEVIFKVEVTGEAEEKTKPERQKKVKPAK